MNIEEIIQRAQQGFSLTSEEAWYLTAWMTESPANESFLRKLDSLAEHKEDIGELKRGIEKDKADMWERIKWQKGLLSARRRKYRISSAAAILIIAVSTGLLLSQPENNLPENYKGNTMPGRSQAILELADGTRIELCRDKDETIQDNGALINIKGDQISYTGSDVAETAIYNTVTIPRAGEYKLVLGDGTTIWLNSESSIKYPQSFIGTERRVILKGEAYFAVVRNEDMPFVVETEGQELTVLGTEFNVYAYHEEHILSTLISGSVRINVGETQQEVILKPGQQAKLENDSRKLNVMTVDVAEVAAWKDGYFSLENMTLEEITHKLSRWYDVKFEFKDEESRMLSFNGSLPRYDDLMSVLYKLQAASPIEFKYRKNVIEIRMH